MAMSPMLYSLSLFYLVILQCFVGNVYSADFIPTRVCGTLYSQINYQGDEFTLMDFDDTEDIRNDFRTSVSGWLNTASYTVESGCSMYVCTEKYFKGRCTLMNETFTQPDGRISFVRSAKCTCQRDCNCQDIIIPKTDFYGIAYLKGKGGCSRCNTEYVKLYSSASFAFSYVDTIKVRSGCLLTLYQTLEYGGKNQVLIQGMNSGIYDEFNSYRFSCNDSAYASPSKIFDTPMIHLPETAEALLHLFSTNDSLVTHPGIQAALKSLQNGRSWKSAYILLIGLEDARWLRISGAVCEKVTGENIRECYISVPVEEYGISYTELRVIYYYSLNGHGLPSNPDEDYVLAASLYDYISNHEELSRVTPNAVVIYHSQPSTDALTQPIWDSSVFQRKLQILSALRPAIVDENYSNIIFYVHTSYDMQLSSLNTWKTNLRQAINSNWAFPKPTVIVLRSDVVWNNNFKWVNGYQETADRKYWPLTLVQKFRAICDMSGDALGKAVFNRMYVEASTPPHVHVSATYLLPKEHILVKQFELCFKNATIQNCFNATQKPKFEIEVTNVLQSVTNVKSMNTRTHQFPPCTCDELLNKLRDLNSSKHADSERNNDVQEKILELNLRAQQLEDKLDDEAVSRDHQLVGKIDSLKLNFTEEVQRLQNLIKLNEEKQSRSVEQIAASESRIQQLEEELATQKNSRVAEFEKMKIEILDDIKSQLKNKESTINFIYNKTLFKYYKNVQV